MKLFLCLILSVAAHAGTVLIASNSSDTTNNSGDPTINLPFVLALPGSTWVSDDPADQTEVIFTTQFSLSGGITGGDLIVSADGTLSVMLNGQILAAGLTLEASCIGFPPGCISLTTDFFSFASLEPYLIDGSNTLSFTVTTGSAAPADLDFAAIVKTAGAPTLNVSITPAPEPAASALLAFGLLTLGALHRRRPASSGSLKKDAR